MAKELQQTLHLPKPESAPDLALEKNELVSIAPTPELNPRNQVLREIAERANADADRDASDSVDAIDDDGNAVAAAPVPEGEPTEQVEPDEEPPTAEVEPIPEAPAAPQFDPNQEYDLVINGKPMKVKGSQIIERGKMAMQKEIAADQKLELASALLQEVQTKLAAQPPAQGVVPQQPQQEALTDEQLAEIIQYGTKEQAAQAIGMLRSAGQSTDMVQRMASQLPRVVQDQLSFHEAAKFVQDEYGDLLSDPYLKQMFFMRENQMRQAGGVDGRGDKRPYKELYKEIGDDLRSHFNRPKTTPGAVSEVPKTREEKVAAKAAAPSAPRLASARMEAAAEKRPATREEIIAKMQAARGQRAA